MISLFKLVIYITSLLFLVSNCSYSLENWKEYNQVNFRQSKLHLIVKSPLFFPNFIHKRKNLPQNYLKTFPNLPESTLILTIMVLAILVESAN